MILLFIVNPPWPSGPPSLVLDDIYFAISPVCGAWPISRHTAPFIFSLSSFFKGQPLGLRLQSVLDFDTAPKVAQFLALPLPRWVLSR